MLKAFALALASAVPAERLSSVRGDKSRDEAIGDTATGNKEYEAVVVRTIRKVNRGLERANNASSRCRRVFAGNDDDSFDS